MGNSFGCCSRPSESRKRVIYHPPTTQRIVRQAPSHKTSTEPLSESDGDDSLYGSNTGQQFSWVLQDEPWNLDQSQFKRWYHHTILNGTGYFKTDCKQLVDEVVQVMYQCMPPHVKVTKVIKGGSLAKGTMIKDLSDIDCVVFIHHDALPYLEDIDDVQDYASGDLAYVIDRMEEAINNNCTNVVSIKRNRFMLCVEMYFNGRTVKVDMLPTADNLEAEGKDEIYKTMLDRRHHDREFYSASLVTLQIDFIKKKPGPVKELIRMVKYWNAYIVKEALEDRWDAKELPTSYPMELITVHAWEEAGSPDSFDPIQGFKAVMLMIAQELDTKFRYWTDNYDKRRVYAALRRMDKQSKRNPLILDPANPFNNVCARFHETWPDVAEVVEETLDTYLLQSVEVSYDWQIY